MRPLCGHSKDCDCIYAISLPHFTFVELPVILTALTCDTKHGRRYPFPWLENTCVGRCFELALRSPTELGSSEVSTVPKKVGTTGLRTLLGRDGRIG